MDVVEPKLADLEGYGDGLGSVVRAEGLVGAVEDFVDGVRADPQPVRDAGAGVAVGGEEEDFPLAAGEGLGHRYLPVVTVRTLRRRRLRGTSRRVGGRVAGRL